ncbi:MAG TPA: CBO0543 family protein [Bacillota bacterium]|nr:CBO0543 family protein [Bacillota bacterium]
MAYILTTLSLWIIFAWLVPLKEWRKFYPTLIATALLGTICDLLGVVFHQWVYHGPKVGSLSLWSDLGIAPAEGGLFIRLYPNSKPPLMQISYLIFWALLNAGWEWFFVKVGWIGYNQWRPYRAFIFYIAFFGLIWLQEYWYQGTGRIKRK